MELQRNYKCSRMQFFLFIQNYKCTSWFHINGVMPLYLPELSTLPVVIHAKPAFICLKWWWHCWQPPTSVSFSVILCLKAIFLLTSLYTVLAVLTTKVAKIKVTFFVYNVWMLPGVYMYIHSNISNLQRQKNTDKKCVTNWNIVTRNSFFTVSSFELKKRVSCYHKRVSSYTKCVSSYKKRGSNYENNTDNVFISRG